MARRQLKQAAMDSDEVVADGNMTSPKKRKTAAKSTMKEPKQIGSRAGLRQAKAEHVNEVINESANPSKKLRGNMKNVMIMIPKISVAVKKDTKSKSKKINKQKEMVENNNTSEEVKNEHLRHLLLFDFNRGSSATQAARNINKVYGKGFITEKAAQEWYIRFREGDFGLNDAPRSEHPVEFIEEQLMALLQKNNRQTSQKLAEQMYCDEETVIHHLHAMGKVQKLGAWVSHVVSQNNKKLATGKSKSTSAANKQKNEAVIENETADSMKNVDEENFVRRTTRRGKTVEESVAPAVAQPAAKVTRKRRNENAHKIVEEAGYAQAAEEEIAINKKLRRAKKIEAETSDALKIKPKEKSKKNSAKTEVAELSTEETETEEQSGHNIAMQKNNIRTKNTKTAKKAAPRGKRNIAGEKINIALAEEASIPEANIEENGDAETGQPKQKKRNIGKVNTVTNEKMEAKKRQKKGQRTAASVDEKKITKDANTENETIEMNSPLEMLEENDTEDSSSNIVSDSASQEEKENKINEYKVEEVEMTENKSLEDEMGRSASFLCFK